MTGSARQGDSGGPVFDRHRQLVAVLFGTNGQVVDGTFCGRVRRFFKGARSQGPIRALRSRPCPRRPTAR